MADISTSVSSRITHDHANGAIRTWFDPNFRADAKQNDAPAAVARRALADSAPLFKWKKTLADLKEERVIDAPTLIQCASRSTSPGYRSSRATSS